MWTAPLFLFAPLVAGMAVRSPATRAKDRAIRADLPWRLQLEDVEPMVNSRELSTLIFAELHDMLGALGVVAHQTTGDFVLVAAPITCQTLGLSVLEAVVTRIYPTAAIPVFGLVDTVKLFTASTPGAFRCCDLDTAGTTACASRIYGTPVWLLFSDACLTVQEPNECISHISRAQFIELQESFATMLGLEYAPDIDRL